MQVIGLDLDRDCADRLSAGYPPIAEPGLEELIQRGLKSGRLRFTSDRHGALERASLLWVTFDTPVDEHDHADHAWVRAQLEQVRSYVQPDTLVLISSQVPVGFTAAVERDWQANSPEVTFAYSPENLRLGNALEVFRHPARVVVGLGRNTDRARIGQLFASFSDNLLWMSLESAEMTKHAINSFLGLSVAYANELARLCERVGADASDVDKGLRSDPRIGQRAYLAPGPPLAGGTLARDLEFLRDLSAEHGLSSPVIESVLRSNALHQRWAHDHLADMLDGLPSPRVALLGLTYKPGTDTLRRSASVELAGWLVDRGVQVSAYDPAVRELPPDLGRINLAANVSEALSAADVAVVATAWPEFAEIEPDTFVARMRQPRILDQAGLLANIGDDPRLTYVRVGRPIRSAVPA